MPNNLSSADIADVCQLLNAFLKQTSLVCLSRKDIDAIDADNIPLPLGNRKRYPDIVKVINRWGIKDNSGGNYHKLLNGIIGKLSLCNPMLQIYKPIQFLLFNKLIEQQSNMKSIFSNEEITVFFLQPYEMIINTDIFTSAMSLNNLIEKTLLLRDILNSNDSKIYLNEGVSRRLSMLRNNVRTISSIYSDKRAKAIDDEEKAILELNVNFFYANVYAILDCAAFVLAFENQDYKIDKENKVDLKKVGLFNKIFYKEFAQLENKLSLIKLTPWYNEIVELRHPIAHRIPLYFPDFYIGDEHQKIQEADNMYFAEVIPTYNDIEKPTNLEEKMIKVNKLDTMWKQAELERQKVKSENSPFAGCFLHSFQETKKWYHLSRLSLDLGILYHLLNETFKYIKEPKNPDQ